MIIFFRFSWFLFKIQILLIKINKQQVISFFLDRYWLRYGPSKRAKYKNPKKGLFKNYIKIFFFLSFYLVQSFIFICFQSFVKSVGEYNFNLFWHKIYAYSQKIILSNFRSLIAIAILIDQPSLVFVQIF
jgi:hypothetical protein